MNYLYVLFSDEFKEELEHDETRREQALDAIAEAYSQKLGAETTAFDCSVLDGPVPVPPDEGVMTTFLESAARKGLDIPDLTPMQYEPGTLAGKSVAVMWVSSGGNGNGREKGRHFWNR